MHYYPPCCNSNMDAEQGGEEVSFSSKGTTISGWGRHKMSEHDKMTATWRQLYLSRAKLKAVSRTSALIAGFAMIAMVEVQLESATVYPPFLLAAFSTVTTCLVSVHLFALMISTCLLPNIEAISNIHSLKAAKFSPHVKMRTYIEVSWILSTGIGLILFLVEIALLIWLKFIGIENRCNAATTTNCTSVSQDDSANSIGKNGQVAAWFATAVLIPVVLLFAGFAFHFYRALAQHKYGVFHSFMREIDQLEQTGDEVSYRVNHGGAVEVTMYNHNELSRLHSGISDYRVRLPIEGENRVTVDDQAYQSSRQSSISGNGASENIQ